ncbi:MAG: hypothetical protein IID32_00585 [Planctomycetes bacterium]|nr:hypothetical protein [Planctomycetota bacterium]
MQIQNRPGSHKFPWISGKVVAHHANILYDRFPYPVEGISGNIFFDPNVVRVGPLVCKQAGANIVYEDHRQRQANRQYSYNIRINVQNATIDETLYHALPQEYHPWWESFDPSGRVDAFYHASQDAQGKRIQELNVKLLDVDAVYKKFPVPLKNIQGQMTITRDQTTLKVDRAEAASGQVSLEGTLTRLTDGTSEISGKGSFQNVLMNNTLIENLPNPLQLHCRQLGLDGRIDGAARIRSLLDPNENTQNPVEYHVKADLRNGRIKYKFFPYELVDVQAKVNLTNDRVDVESLIARNASAHIQMNGTFKSNQNFQLHVKAENLELNDDLREAVEDHINGLWEKLNPKGQIDAKLDISRQSEQSPVKLTGVIEPKRSEIHFKNIDYPLRNIVGTIRLQPDQIILDELTSTNGPSKITLSGTMGRNDNIQNNFDIQAVSIPLDDKLAKELPDGFKAFKDHIGLSGTLDGKLTVSYRPTKNETDRWEYQAEVTMTEGQITQPVPFTNIKGHLVGEGEYKSRSKALTLSANLIDASMLIKNRPMENLNARIEYGDPNHLLTLRNIDGRFCNGQLSGQADIFLTNENAGYEVQLTTRNVDLAELLEAGKEPDERRKNLKGRLGGWINVQQDIAMGPRRGMFQFFVTDAVLGELPILAQLLHLINFSWPKEGAFNEVTVLGNIVDEITRFDSIFLKGSAISLNGLGQMKGEDNQLHLIFLVGSPHQIPPIPGITDLVTLIQPALSHLRVTGTFDNPKVESVAFPTFEKTLKYFQTEKQP